MLGVLCYHVTFWGTIYNGCHIGKREHPGDEILFGLDFRMTGAQGGYSGFQVSEMTEGFFEIFYFGIFVVCYTAVFSVVTQRSSPGALRDDAKNGCVAD